MNFSEALENLKMGAHMARRGWGKSKEYVALQRRTQQSFMTRNYLFLSTEDDERVPWVISHEDLLAEDWFVL